MEVGEFKFRPALIEFDPLCTAMKTGKFYHDFLSQAICCNFSPCMRLMPNKLEILGFKCWLKEWVTKTSCGLLSAKWLDQVLKCSPVHHALSSNNFMLHNPLFFHYCTLKELINHPFTKTDRNLDNKFALESCKNI